MHPTAFVAGHLVRLSLLIVANEYECCLNTPAKRLPYRLSVLVVISRKSFVLCELHGRGVARNIEVGRFSQMPDDCGKNHRLLHRLAEEAGPKTAL
jgi:hypothetical protein